jgi:hypothetical protein
LLLLGNDQEVGHAAGVDAGAHQIGDVSDESRPIRWCLADWLPGRSVWPHLGGWQECGLERCLSADLATEFCGSSQTRAVVDRREEHLVDQREKPLLAAGHRREGGAFQAVQLWRF